MNNPEVFENPSVADVFEAYPEHVRSWMLELRSLIFHTASEIDEVGPLEETLKWGEPSYLTQVTKSGSTIRIDWKKRRPDHYAVYFNCQTNLVNTFRELYSDVLMFEGSRSIVLPLNEPIPEKALSHCISMALRYHLDKKRMR